MEISVKYRGKVATRQDVIFIKELIKENPDVSRRGLSVRLCKEWNWVQPNGVLRDMVCRGFLLALDRAGYIKLPPKKFTPNNPLANRKKPVKVKIEQSLVETTVSNIKPLQIYQVRNTPKEKIFNSLINQFHYLGYTQPVGENLKYMVYKDERPVACISFCSAPLHIEYRDRFIGWDIKARKKNLHLIAYNTRYLILPWVRVKYLASHILSKIVKIIPYDWERVYHHPIYYVDTFIDTEKFKGISYQSANWRFIGKTKGLGKNNHDGIKNRSIKDIYCYPLVKNFKELLQRY